MSSIIPFDFETNAVRVVMHDSEPCFVAADVCRVIEISKYRDAIAQLDDDERVSVLVDTLGGRQAMTAVTESGLYALIMMSRKPAARRFRKWVTAEVLPAIRRDGSYSLVGTDRAMLAEKRAFFGTLPGEHQDKARVFAAAVRRIEDDIAAGMTASAAIAAEAEASGLSVRTLYGYRARIYMAQERDYEAACAPRWKGRRGILAQCHPDAARLFMDLCLSGARASDCYRRVMEEAKAHGWSPLPAARTFYRMAERHIPRPPKPKKEAA